MCLHSLIGSAESFYHQIISIAPRGYRIISVQIPVYWTIAEFCDAFHSFLETIPHRRLHLFGAGLGGFLAMHYASRKPDRVASLFLTHSFLTTENLNLRISYSAAVLRWLPEFMVRTTMRAILPKGRVSLDMANAAELAIGHTMLCSRDALASRLALSVTSSTVVNRVHIPETSITLVDSLDRPANSLALSELTASQFPTARRALLKKGGDFPYISVPDEVNVHLIVHLRRNGADPISDVSVPVPARPMLMPVSTRRRRSELARQVSESENQDNEDEETEEKQTRKLRCVEELEKEAKEIIDAGEQSNIERYGYEIARLSEFLPGKSDVYISTVLESCEGSLDTAITNALEDHYNDTFYEVIYAEQLEKVIAELRQADLESPEDSILSEDDVCSDFLNEERITSGASDTEDSSSTTASRQKQRGDNEDKGIASSYQRKDFVNADPLGETEFLLNYSKSIGSAEVGSNNDDDLDKGKAVGDGTVVLSSVPISPSDGIVSREEENDERRDSEKPADSPISEMATVDLGTDHTRLTDEAVKTRSKGGTPNSGKSETEPDSANRQEQQRRRNTSPKVDVIVDYVSSEKVGMRSRGPLVGRGPAPFNKVSVEGTLNPGEAWKRTALVKEEREDETGLGGKGKSQISLSSGASLLDATDNPLGLPGDDDSYAGRGFNALPGLVNVQKYGKETRGSKSMGGTPTMPFHEKPESAVQNTPVLALSGESLLGNSSGNIVNVRGPAETDEWERFRKGEDGIGEVVPVVAVPVERALNKTFEVADGDKDEDKNGASRLRAWSMSAQAASKNVHR